MGRPPHRKRLAMDWKLELVAVPVSDVDRAKAFYTEQVGFVADHDHSESAVRLLATRCGTEEQPRNEQQCEEATHVRMVEHRRVGALGSDAAQHAALPHPRP